MPRRGFQKKDKLVEAAIREFGSMGFLQASLNHILEEAQVSKGVFYHHFENKDALYLHVVGHLLQLKKEYLSTRLVKEDLTGGFFSILHSQIRLGLQFGREHPEMALFSGSLMKERGTDIYQRVMQAYPVNQDAGVQALIRQAMDAGDLRTDLPPSFLSDLIVFLLQHINEILDTRSVEDYSSRVDALLTCMETGLGRQK